MSTNYDTMPFHDTAEKIVDILCKKTDTPERGFFRVLVAYYFCKVASNMRVDINTMERGKIPINLYAINLGPSGLGKGYSTNIVEENIVNLFHDRFMEESFISMSDEHLDYLAPIRAQKTGNEDQVEKLNLKGEFKAAGNYLFSFDSATLAAVKQLRDKLLLAGIGAISLEIDEIGSNLLSNVDALKVFFELFDVGKAKQKLLKNTAENTRSAELKGRTPTNMCLFGTPSKLFDGGKTEEEFFSMVEAGFGRRCFFAITHRKPSGKHKTAKELLKILTNSDDEDFLHEVAGRMEELADTANFKLELQVEEPETLMYLDYKIHCDKQAEKLADHQTTLHHELSHRYFKALKLAGAYAFYDGSPNITQTHLAAGIRMAEESGKAFQEIMKPDKPWVKLAKYLAQCREPVTQADLAEELPFYKGTAAHKSEMMTLAIAHGYRNNIVIKRNQIDGIEFLSGETLKETDINKVTLSCSNDFAYHYNPEKPRFDEIHKLTQLDGYHWAVHHFTGKHRAEANVIKGFDLVVLDVDGEATMETVELLLENYTYHIYTTKSHTPDKHRFRVVLPMSHHLEMDKETYTEFMKNIYDWLPFDVDTSTHDRCRKWLSHEGEYKYNFGDELLDALLFIPKTSKNAETKEFIADHAALTRVERWFVDNTESGNRSNHLIRYAYMLLGSGMDRTSIQNNIMALNQKFPKPLSDVEVLSTIMVTVDRKLAERGN